MAFATDFPDAYYHELLMDYTQKRDRRFDALASLGLEAFPSAGTYYLVSDIRSRGKELVLWCFCKKDEILEDAIKRLNAFFKR